MTYEEKREIENHGHVLCEMRKEIMALREQLRFLEDKIARVEAGNAEARKAARKRGYV